MKIIQANTITSLTDSYTIVASNYDGSKIEGFTHWECTSDGMALLECAMLGVAELLPKLGSDDCTVVISYHKA